MSGERRAPDVRASYRVQLNAGFTFDDAAAIAGYLADLGISHLYCSPYLQAASGSTHGYDVVDHSRLNTELGGAEGHARMSAALAENGMGQILDIVPNHMALAGRSNAWWWDVLENGPSSQYAAYFDIDWDPPESKLLAKVLVPVLGDHYGRVIESGELTVARRGGSLLVRYHDHEVPLSPRSLDVVLAPAAERLRSGADEARQDEQGSPADELESIANALGRLPHALATDRESVRERHRDKEVLRNRLARLCDEHPAVARAVDEEVDALNHDHDRLDSLLQRQNYRVAYWRTAGRELDYRRFFDVATLVALRVEDPQVFDDTHALVLDLVSGGVVDGLRIDHVDGLRDPAGYLTRLREQVGGATYLVVEKILAAGERLPSSWPVAGTSGYDFLNLANTLFVDPAGEEAFTDLYSRFTGQTSSFDEVAWVARQQVMRDVLSADLDRLTALAVEVCERHRRYRDYTRAELRDTLREVIAGFSVYRTYVHPGDFPTATDVDHVEDAVRRAATRRPDLDTELLAFLADVLLLRHAVAPAAPGGPPDPEHALAERFQQVTAPVMAKGVEDTAFYRYHRLISLNEVGGEPGRFGMSVDDFHRANAETAARWPRAMLAGSTHDTKRSEDVRARINLLAEIPAEWEAAVWRWTKHNERHRRGEGMPDRNLEYLLYQTLVGAWPVSVERAAAFAAKATREAKVHTSWIDPVPAYDEAVQDFVAAILGDPDFVGQLEAFVAPLVEPGRLSSLAQTTLRLTAPGVPDVYQGTEVFDLSLVDPDNRRPVDYAERRSLLRSVAGAGPVEALALTDRGGPKMWLVRRLLGLRRDFPGLFAPDAGYRPLAAGGSRAERVVAYLRGGELAVVVPRLVLGLRNGWDGTTVDLPAGRWQNVVDGEAVDVAVADGDAGGHGSVAVADLLAIFPVAVLRRKAA